MSGSANKPRPRTGAERMAAHRARMRARGLVPRTIWVPDWRAPDFAAEAGRQARAAAADPQEREIMDWLDGARAWPAE
jgi:hypothetical protein